MFEFEKSDEEAKKIAILRITPEVKFWARELRNLTSSQTEEQLNFIRKFKAAILEVSDGQQTFSSSEATNLLASGMALGYLISKSENHLA